MSKHRPGHTRKTKAASPPNRQAAVHNAAKKRVKTLNHISRGKTEDVTAQLDGEFSQLRGVYVQKLPPQPHQKIVADVDVDVQSLTHTLGSL